MDPECMRLFAIHNKKGMDPQKDMKVNHKILGDIK